MIASETVSHGVRRTPTQSRSRASVAAILEATALLLEAGLPVTTNTIAERAGVSIGTLYQYFSDRTGILSQLVTTRLAAALASLTDAPARPGLDRVLAFVTAACHWRAGPAVHLALDALPDADVAAIRAWMEPPLEAALLPHLERILRRPLRPEWVRAVVHGVCAAIDHGARTGAAHTPEFPHEMAIMVVGALTADRVAWRAATGMDPVRLGARRWWDPTGQLPRVSLVPRWLKTAPRQPRAHATLDAIIAAAGEQVFSDADADPERVAQLAGVSIGTLYRYFQNRYAPVGQVGLALLERFTARFMDLAPAIWSRRPARTVQDLTMLTLDPLRSPWARWLRRITAHTSEGRVMREHIDRLAARISPLMTAHPWCGVAAENVVYGLWAVDGVCTRLVLDEGMEGDPTGFGELVEATAIMVYSYYRIDRETWPAVLAGAASLDSLHAAYELA